MSATSQPAIRTHPFLSTSRIQSGRQCHRRMWLELHHPGAAVWSDAALARPDESAEFRTLARQLLGGGVLIEASDREIGKALIDTRAELVKQSDQTPLLFEAAFEYEGVCVRVDALHRHATGDMLIEVNSKTLIEDEHVWDCAIKTWVARGAGRNVERIILAHVNRDFVYRQEGDFDGLLKKVDVTAGVEFRLPDIPLLVKLFGEVADGPEPAVTTSSHCSNPYPCPFLFNCRSSEPRATSFPLAILPRSRRLVATLTEGGFDDLRAVPETLLQDSGHRRMAAAARDFVPYVAPELRTLLDAIPYPRHVFDLETVELTIPRWLGTRPFQPVPFQFSCHIEQMDGALQHREFLDISGGAPMPGVVANLLAALGKRGPILVWDSGLQPDRLRHIAERYPEHASALSALTERMIELQPIFREHYFHPRLRGSWSLESVFSTVAPDLASARRDAGLTPQQVYVRGIDLNTTDEERERIRCHLLARCERNTYAIVRLARWRPDFPF